MAQGRLDRRLQDGIAWARTEGRRNLTTLLEDIRDELARLREDSGGCLHDAEDTEGGLHDLDNRVGALERRLADLEDDVSSLQARLQQLQEEDDA